MTQFTVNITTQLAELKCGDKVNGITKLDLSKLEPYINKFICVYLFHYTTTVYLTSLGSAEPRQ